MNEYNAEITYDVGDDPESEVDDLLLDLFADHAVAVFLDDDRRYRTVITVDADSFADAEEAVAGLLRRPGVPTVRSVLLMPTADWLKSDRNG